MPRQALEWTHVSLKEATPRESMTVSTISDASTLGNGEASLIGVVALLSGAPERDVLLRLDVLRSTHRGVFERGSHGGLKALLEHYGIGVSHSRCFSGWEGLPPVALLPDRWHRQRPVSMWSWKVFLGYSSSALVVKPSPDGSLRVTVPRRLAPPPWFLEVRPVCPSAVRGRLSGRI